MTVIKSLVPLAAAVVLTGCETTHDRPAAPLGNAVLSFADGRPAGTAQLFATGDGVTVAVGLIGFEPGTHAVHLHMTGSCEAPGFTSAGGHLNPGMKQHGSENPMGSHLGDMRNVEIGENGTGTASSRLMGTRDEILSAIYDADGTAVVVHAGPDDYMSDPAGNAGGRLACGVIQAH